MSDQTGGPREPEALLRVADALPDDIGRQVARVPANVMTELGVLPDDVVQLIGRKTTVARAAPLPSGETAAVPLARLDSITRQNASVGIDEQVAVRSTTAKPARNLVLVALDSVSTLASPEASGLAKALVGQPLMAGDAVTAAWPGAQRSYFEVHASAPQGPVIVNESTKIVFAEGDAAVSPVDRTSYEDIGGLDEEVRRIREMVELPIRFPRVFERLGVEAPKGVLLYGPPGTGKTLIARAVAHETSATFVHINGPEIVNKLYGESEARLRELFEMAQREAPAIVFIDEIDAVAPKRTEVFGDVEKRIVAQLLALMDGLKGRGQVIVIAATNVPHMVDPALRRPGRFDRELSINPPDRDGRLAILRIHSRSMRLDDAVDIEHLADVTHGFVGADLAVLCKEAGMRAVRRILKGADPSPGWPDDEQLSTLRVTAEDFEDAFREVEPTAVRELFAEKPTATWADVAGLAEVREQLQALVDLSARQPSQLRRGQLPRGVLLTGPAGSGKTLVANAFAGSTGAHFISVDPATLAARWRGEAERGIRQTFKRAKQIAPCIVFFDELDTLAPSREAAAGRDSSGVVSQLCVELDHLMETANVMVVAATSRPEAVDMSLMRPGRFDLVVDLPLPDATVRLQILELHTRDLCLAPDVDLDSLSRATDGRSGAELAALCRSALMHALRGNPDWRNDVHGRQTLTLTPADFERGARRGDERPQSA